MPRKSNWPALLTRFIAAKQAQPFDWAENNCCFFAADWCRELTGIDPAADLRGQVPDLATAQAILARHGGAEELAAQRCAEHGWREISAAFAQRGDIATVPTPHGPALGVVLGRLVAFAGPHGVEFLPLKQTNRAWRIA